MGNRHESPNSLGAISIERRAGNREWARRDASRDTRMVARRFEFRIIARRLRLQPRRRTDFAGSTFTLPAARSAWIVTPRGSFCIRVASRALAPGAVVIRAHLRIAHRNVHNRGYV